MNEEHVASYYLFMFFNFCSHVTAPYSTHSSSNDVPKCQTPCSHLFFGGFIIFSYMCVCVLSKLPHHSCMQSLNSTRKFSLCHLTVNAERRKVIKIKSNYMMFWDEKVDITYSLRTLAH